MKTYAYRIVNVFTRGGRLTGNPLAVFEDGRGLDRIELAPREQGAGHGELHVPAELPLGGPGQA